MRIPMIMMRRRMTVAMMILIIVMMHSNTRSGGRLDGRRVSSLGDEMYYTIEPEKVKKLHHGA